MENLVKLNDITSQDMLTGKEEAQAFDNKEFVRLHQSTLRKVDVLANIAERAIHDDLKTLASWWERHGLGIKAKIEWLKEHWIMTALTLLFSVAALIYKVLTFFQIL